MAVLCTVIFLGASRVRKEVMVASLFQPCVREVCTDCPQGSWRPCFYPYGSHLTLGLDADLCTAGSW